MKKFDWNCLSLVGLLTAVVMCIMGPAILGSLALVFECLKAIPVLGYLLFLSIGMEIVYWVVPFKLKKGEDPMSAALYYKVAALGLFELLLIGLALIAAALYVLSLIIVPLLVIGSILGLGFLFVWLNSLKFRKGGKK